MEINISWYKPLQLSDGNSINLIYACEAVDEISEKAGIYVFSRKFGGSRIPIYIGQAQNLRRRIDQQLNNVRLMIGIKNEPNGKRELMIGKLQLDRGQQADKVLNIVESALMKSALSSGHELLNIQGTKNRAHVIKSNGKKKYHSPFPRTMNAESR
jgi:hypothetical protein